MSCAFWRRQPASTRRGTWRLVGLEMAFGDVSEQTKGALIRHKELSSSSSLMFHAYKVCDTKIVWQWSSRLYIFTRRKWRGPSRRKHGKSLNDHEICRCRLRWQGIVGPQRWQRVSRSNKEPLIQLFLTKIKKFLRSALGRRLYLGCSEICRCSHPKGRHQVRCRDGGAFAGHTEMSSLSGRDHRDR